MTEQNLRVCVIGASEAGSRHINGWLQVENAEVVAIVDDVVPRLKEAGRQFGVTALFTDYQKAIIETRPNVVSVCIPTSVHAIVSIYAMEHGANVLCEKPISLTLEDADLMIATARRTGVLLGVSFVLRYSKAVEELKRWVKSGKLGRPILYTAENFMEVRPRILMHAKEIYGGPLLDYWCHHFDLWNYLFDSSPTLVAGYGAILAKGKTEVANMDPLAIDTAGVIVRYASGDIGQLSTSWGLPTALSGSVISSDKLVGPNGLVTGNVRREMTLHKANGNTEEINNRGIDWWRDEILAFSRSIRSGEQPLVDGQAGRAALTVSLAAIKAIETGQTIAISS